MQGVPELFDHPVDRAEFMRAPRRAGLELYRAHIVRHAFDPHVHQAFGLGAIDSGVERFRYRGADHLAPSASIVLMHPDEVHTGRAETEGGWRYRMAYIEPALVEAVSGERGWGFDAAVVHDPARAKAVSARLGRLWEASDDDDALAFDGHLAALLDVLRPLARTGRPGQAERGRHGFAAVLDFMQAHLAQRVTLEQLAAVAGLSPFHFLRRFRAECHASPHQMLMALRLFEAKQRLARGEAPAGIAAAVGLVDQAHLTRRFARMYGVTPARYQQQLGTRPRAPR